jgi:hypothetical protein
MLILVRNEIKDFFTENQLKLSNHVQPVLERGDPTNFPVVSFTYDNSMVLDIGDDEDVLSYLSSIKVHPFETLFISSLLCDGFIKLIRGYYNTIENELSN